jgi:hypothetical protein
MGGIRAISIDPTTKAIAKFEISPETRLLRGLFGVAPTVSLQLTKGDVLLTAGLKYGEAFTVGGSRPIIGPGLIVGRRIGPGERGPARVVLDDVVTMVRWTLVEAPVRSVPSPPTSMRAIVIDPRLGLVEEQAIAPHMPAAERLLGGVHDWHIRLPTGDYLLSAKTDREYCGQFRYGDLALYGRCVIVGHDHTTDYFDDVAMTVDHLRERVEFRGPEDKHWIRYVDRKAAAEPAPAH